MGGAVLNYVRADRAMQRARIMAGKAIAGAGREVEGLDICFNWGGYLLAGGRSDTPCLMDAKSTHACRILGSVTAAV
jgi:hypothetical protein